LVFRKYLWGLKPLEMYSYHIISYHITSYHIVSYRNVSYHTIYHMLYIFFIFPV